MTKSRPDLRTIALAAAIAIAVAGCGVATTGQTATAAGSAVVVTLNPTSATLEPDGEFAFDASVTGTADAGLTWAVVEGSVGGSVASGKYKAPASEGVFHVVATSVADPTKNATATITASRTRIDLTPATATVNGCQTATFTAKVTGRGTTAVDWTVGEGSAGGSISAAGVYTAPAAAGTYHVVATSRADATKAAAATVTVATKVLSVSMSPVTVALAAGGSSKLSATVVTTCGSFASP